MAKNKQRGWTLVVMGQPGEATRRFHVGPGFIIVGIGLLSVLSAANLAAGYVLGQRTQPQAALASPSLAPGDDAVAKETTQVATRTAQAPGAEEPAPALPPPSEAEPSEPQDGLSNGPPPADTPPMRVLFGEGTNETLDLHPFTAGGEPRRSAFEALAAVMACPEEGETDEPPDVELVRLLAKAQAHFNRPMIFLGGRCGGHDDRSERHGAGQAADVRLRGVSSERLNSWFVEQNLGGIGRYKRKGFVHVDMREPAAHWEDGPASAGTRKARPEQRASKRAPKVQAPATDATATPKPEPAEEPMDMAVGKPGQSAPAPKSEAAEPEGAKLAKQAAEATGAATPKAAE